MLFEEIDGLEARGVDTSKLVVSAIAHVIAPYNRTLDKVTERFLGSRRIGTTGRGIGPTYADKMSRIGIRVQDLFDEDVLRAKVDRRAEPEEPDAGQDLQPQGASTSTRSSPSCSSYAERLRPMVADTSLLLEQMLDDGKTVVLEAGQATLLDVDHGTYPFVTSSNATAGGACTGSGIPPTRIEPGDRGRQGVHDPRRRGPVPDRAARRQGRAAAPGRRRVRHDHRPAAPLRLVRRVDRAATPPGSTASPTSS